VLKCCFSIHCNVIAAVTVVAVNELQVGRIIHSHDSDVYQNAARTSKSPDRKTIKDYIIHYVLDVKIYDTIL
jgi:hypothetical protein